MCDIPGAGGKAGLMNLRAFARVKPLLVATQGEIGLRQSDAFNRAQLLVAFGK